MIGFALILSDRVRSSVLGPAGLALVSWAVLAVLLLPVAHQGALSAGPRAVVDFGFLGLQVALGISAVALGATALGPPLRRGEVDIWRAHGVSIDRWTTARLIGSLLGLIGLLLVGVLVQLGIGGALGAAVPLHLGPWMIDAALQASVVFTLVAATSVALRGAVGPLVGGVWLMVGRVAGAASDSVIGQVLGWLAPDLAALDAHAALLGVAEPGPIVPDLIYASAWTMACVLAAVLISARVARR